MIEIWQRHADAIRVLRAYAPIPGADVIGSEEVWAAESIGQALQPAVIVNGRAPRSGRAGKNHGFSAVSRFYVVQAQGDDIECLFPTDTHPARIGITFRPGAQQRIWHAIRRVNDVRRGGAFHTNATVGMLRIGIDSDEFAVFDGSNHAAARGAH